MPNKKPKYQTLPEVIVKAKKKPSQRAVADETYLPKPKILPRKPGVDSGFRAPYEPEQYVNYPFRHYETLPEVVVHSKTKNKYKTLPNVTVTSKKKSPIKQVVESTGIEMYNPDTKRKKSTANPGQTKSQIKQSTSNIKGNSLKDSIKELTAMTQFAPMPFVSIPSAIINSGIGISDALDAQKQKDQLNEYINSAGAMPWQYMIPGPVGTGLEAVSAAADLTDNFGLEEKKNGGWLDNYGKKENANEGRSSAPSDWIGEGYSTQGRNYSPAWGGQFEEGGMIPQAQNGYTTDPKIAKANKDSFDIANRAKLYLKDRHSGIPNEYIINDQNFVKDVPYSQAPEQGWYEGVDSYAIQQGKQSVYGIDEIKPSYFKGYKDVGGLRYMPMYDVPKQMVKLKPPPPPEPTLKRKPVAVQPITANTQNFTPQLRTIEQPNIELPAVERGQYRTSYYDPQMKDWNERAFMTQKESDQFADEMSKRGYPGSYGNVTQRTQYQLGGNVYPVNYVPQAQDGLTFLDTNSPKLPSSYVIPYRTPSSELASSVGGEDGEPAFLIPTFKYGHPLEDPDAEFRKTGEHLGGPFKTWQEADTWDREIRHPYVEKGQSIPTPLRRWGKDFAMGGKLSTAQTGDKLSATDETSFQKFFGTLPMNLRRDEPDYNIRGYWNALGRPSEFDYSQPKQDDGYYHAFSRNPETGEILKAPFHHTFDKAIDRGNPDYLPIVTPEGKIKTITERQYFPQEEVPVNAPLRQDLELAMGGSLPGSVGFTYARTKGIPSEGPYAKKTLPSAQNGQEMSFYQHGLDWKPKSISKNGGWLDKYIPEAQTGFVIPGVTDFKMPLNRTDATGRNIQEQQRQDAAALEMQRVNNATAKRQFVGQGQASTKESEARRKRLNKQSIIGLPNAQYNEQTGNVSTINPNMTAEGKPANFMGERQQKGYEHVMGALEAAGYVIPVLEGVGVGYNALKKGISTLPGPKTIALSKMLDNSKLNTELANNLYANRILQEELVAPNVSYRGTANFPEGKLIDHLGSPFLQKNGRMYYITDFENGVGLNDVTYDFMPTPGDKYPSKYFKKLQKKYNVSDAAESEFKGSMYNNYYPHDENVSSIDDWIIHNDVGQIPNNRTWWKKGSPYGGAFGRSLFDKPFGRHVYAKQSALESALERPLDQHRELIGDIIEKGRLPNNGLTITPTGESFLPNVQGLKTFTYNPLTKSMERGILKKKKGGVIKDDRGQWAHPGEITEIGSNRITMQGVPYPVLGISDTGDQQMMFPGEEYKFKGKKVTEFPMAQDGNVIYTNDPLKVERYQDSLQSYNNYYNKYLPEGIKAVNESNSIAETEKRFMNLKKKLHINDLLAIDSPVEKLLARKEHSSGRESFYHNVDFKKPVQPYILEPTLKRKPVKMETIKSKSSTTTPGIKTMSGTPVKEPPVPKRGEYRVSYYNPDIKDWSEQAFETEKESDKFADEMSKRGYGSGAGNVTQTRKVSRKENGGWLSQYK
jgi:hypothetical protein